MKSSRLTSFCLAIITIVMMMTVRFTVLTPSAATDTRHEVSVTSLHNIEDNSGYNLTGTNKTSTLISGHSRLGDLTIIGNCEKRSYKGFEAYALYGDNVRFEYKQNVFGKSYNGKEWRLSNDSATAVAGINTGKIDSGAIVIMKSLDEGKTWNKVTTSVNINGKTITFQPDSADIQSGVLYKFISVAEVYYSYTYQSGTEKKYPSYGDAPWYVQILSPVSVGAWILANGWDEPVYSTANQYENLAQVSIVYLASDSCEVGFYSNASDSYDLSIDFPDVGSETLEMLRKGTTLSHGSVAFDSFRLDKLGNKSFEVFCSYNGGSFLAVEDNQVFYNPGKYSFTIRSKFGTTRTCDITIFHPGDDFGYSQYFGSGFVSQNMRLFDETSPMPIYMVGTTLNLSPRPFIPGLYGGIYRYHDTAALERDEYTTVCVFDGQTNAEIIRLDEEGIYCADLYVGNPTASGECIHYTFFLQVVNRPNYQPSVNKELLTSQDRKFNLKTAGYAVNFSTAGGGSYIFMFPYTPEGKDEALRFSEQIEYRFIEEYTDSTNGKKFYYYKAHGTSGLKIRFDSKVELYSEIINYATANVNPTYRNPTEGYATMTLDEAVENIENTSIRNDVRVCIDSDTRDKLTAETIINGYSFFQPAPYEVDCVTATSSNGKIYNIPFDTPIENILPATGKYVITESNWNSSTSYSVTYFAKGDITASLSFAAYKDYSEFSGKISSSNSAKTIEANSIRLVSGSDPYDSQTLVSIVTTGKRVDMTLGEVNNYAITEPGNYTITLTNRVGNTVSVTVKLTEAPKTQVKFDGYSKYNRKVKVGEALGELPVVEKEGYTFEGWLVDGQLVTASTVCNWKQEVVLTPWFEPQTTEVVLSYFNGYQVIKAKFGSSVNLPAVENIEDFFVFAYWSIDEQPISQLRIDNIKTYVLVAKYFRVDDNNNPITDVAYSADEISDMKPEIAPETDYLISEKDSVPSEVPEIATNEEVTGGDNIISSEFKEISDIEVSAPPMPENSETNYSAVIIAFLVAFLIIAIIVIFLILAIRY